MPKHLVLHPVLHDRKIYGRGSEIILSAHDAETLHKLGSVGPVIETESSEELVAEMAVLATMTKSALIEYAAENFELALSSSLAKAELIERITLAHETAADLAKKVS